MVATDYPPRHGRGEICLEEQQVSGEWECAVFEWRCFVIENESRQEK
jgi:hypothetical protein